MKSLRDPKRKPTHPGEVLRKGMLPALEMSHDLWELEQDPKRFRNLEPVAA
jgi:hypothetical protein